MVCKRNSSGCNKGLNMKNSVEVKKLAFNYGKLEILKNLDLNIQDGEFMVLTWPIRLW